MTRSPSVSCATKRWELELAPLDAARTCLDLVAQQWDRRLERLKLLVESE